MIEVYFIERRLSENEISIEKLFNIIRQQLTNNGVKCIVEKNPYKFSIVGVILAIFHFKRKQKNVNHITGDIHWASIALKGKKSILTIHDTGSKYQKMSYVKKKLFMFFWYYIPLKKLKYIVAISNKVKRDLVSMFPWAEKKIVVIPNCCTMDISSSTFIGIVSTPKILIIGTRENKNIERIISALNEIVCEVIIIGKLSHKQTIILNESNLSYKNYYNISESELISFYQEADIVPFISLFEGFGLPILEAQSQNCIVVTSKIEPLLEVAGTGAYYVDPYSVSSIKDAIMCILSDKELQKKLVKEGRENVIRYSKEYVANEYRKLYDKILY